MLRSEGSELSAQRNDGQFEVFDNQSSLECDTWSNHSSFDEECTSCTCFSITESAKQDFGKADCNHNIPQTCGSTSLPSYGSHGSSFGCPHNDLHSKNRFVAVDSIDTGQTLERDMAVNYLEREDSFPHIETESSYVECGSSGSMLQMSLAEHTPSSSLTCEIHGKSSDGKVEIFSPGAEDAKQTIKTSSLSIIDADPLIWTPPEPEEMETAIDSVADYEDCDGECDDDISGVKPSSLRGLDEEKWTSYSHKEERKRLLAEVMNGQFKITVSRCLASVDISVSGHDASENWLDIVTRLSWKAALLVKPDASEGRDMDPASYLKVKCIASGSRSQSYSQVIKGLVFKKCAAHKHMPTKLRNPRLLLLKGSLGHSASGLSSFESMGQEKDHLKSIIDVIVTCHPNVIFVERSVSRDIQEILLGKRITLVFDMKLPRMERIARATGSQISAIGDTILKSDLKHCESFHIEKFVEEHNSFVEGVKRPAKTLMFLEGCPKPLACTILLNGSNSEELKKIKHALRCTVFSAYSLILETSFFADQKTFFFNMNSAREVNVVSPAEMVSSFNLDVMKISNLSHGKDSLAAAPSADDTEIPISDASITDSITYPGFKFRECSIDSSMLTESSITCSGDNTMHGNVHNTGDSLLYVSDVSASDNLIVGENLSPLSSQFMSSNFGFTENEDDYERSALVCPLETIDHEKHLDEDVHKTSDREFYIGENASYSSGPAQTIERIDEFIKNAKVQNEDDVESGLDPQSILVLMFRYCTTKQVACEDCHLSRIKFYGNFDLPLGRYLTNILLSQKLTCSSCGQPTEAHVYRYTHQNGNLTAIVKTLPKESVLPGEAKGKIWMWIWCLKCERAEGHPKVSRRVMMSSLARALSFGKFLDLSFSNRSAANGLSKCGHLLHRDCLRFFGFGSKVAMFRYSPIEIYAACKPQPMLEFYNQNGQEWLCKEAKEVLTKAEHLFGEIMDILKNMVPQRVKLPEQMDKFSGSMKQISEVEDMLKQERTAFEASLLEFVYSDLHERKNGILDLSWLIQELLLLLYIWDRRLHFLVQSAGSFLREATTEVVQSEKGNTARESIMQVPVIFEESFSGGGDQHAGNHPKSLDEVSIPILDNLVEENSIPGEIEPLNLVEANKPQQKPKDSESKSQKATMFHEPCNPDAEDSDQWIWSPFSELREDYRKDLHGGSLHKFQFINGYIPIHLIRAHKLIARKYSLHFAVGSGGNIISLADEEISSIIACALALFKDQDGLVGVVAEKKGKGEAYHTTDTSYGFEGLVDLSACLTAGSFEIEAQSSPSEELASHDLSFFVDEMKHLHPEVNVGTEKVAGKSKYSVICIYAKDFYSLRKKCCPSELSYISSLSRCKKWDARGGKSKVFFAKTMDDRFIIKQIKKTELDSFLKFGPEYFKYLSFSLDSGSQTCLAKILGVYQVRQFRNGKEVKTDLMVMENLLFGRNASRKYDLKGAVYSRYISDANDLDRVLLDENFVEDMRFSPVFVDRRTKHLLQRAIWNDTAFLTTNNVVDYSLFVGLDKEHHELVFGIIDYVRQYTWDKQLETWVKSSLVPKNALPTVISPKEYKKRFRKFMSKYFLTLPDTWNCNQS